jgi:predicted RNA-binding Zn-ribbon protein involved in translation (DUF1610 family)
MPEDVVMTHNTVVSATLGLCYPWQVTSVSISIDEKRIDISVDFDPGGVISCPDCGEERNISAAGQETWYHDDFFNRAAYLHTVIPRIHCPSCGNDTVERPWTRTGSRFTLVEPSPALNS